MSAPLTRAEVQLFSDMEDTIADALIQLTWARALKIAPCLKEMAWADEDADDTDPLWENTQLVKGILRDAVLRRDEAGVGVVTSRAAGDFQESLRYSGGLFQPSEIRDLQQLCTEYRSKSSASTHLTMPEYPLTVQHAPWCDKFLAPDSQGAVCECGAELTESGLPLWDH